MKNILLLLALVVLVPASRALSNGLSVTSVSGPICTLLDPKTKVICVTNPKANSFSVYLTIDGSVATSAGVEIQPGVTFTWNFTGAVNSGAQSVPKIVSPSGTETININTDTTVSTP